GVVVLLLAPAPQVVDQRADFGRRELEVRNAADRRKLLGADRRAAGRHHHLLVPGEERHRLPEVGDLGQASAELLELCLRHGREMYMAGRGEAPRTTLPPAHRDTAMTVDGVCIRRLPGPGSARTEYGDAAIQRARAVASKASLAFNKPRHGS